MTRVRGVRTTPPLSAGGEIGGPDDPIPLWGGALTGKGGVQNPPHNYPRVVGTPLGTFPTPCEERRVDRMFPAVTSTSAAAHRSPLAWQARRRSPACVQGVSTGGQGTPWTEKPSYSEGITEGWSGWSGRSSDSSNTLHMRRSQFSSHAHDMLQIHPDHPDHLVVKSALSVGFCVQGWSGWGP